MKKATRTVAALLIRVTMISAILFLLISTLLACTRPAPTPTPAPAPKPLPAASPSPSPTTPAPAPKPAPAPEQVYKWKWFTTIPRTEWAVQRYLMIAPEIEQKSGGRLKIDVFAPGEHPYKPTEMLKVAREGMAEMLELADAYLAGDEPLIDSRRLPFMWSPDYEKVKKPYETLGKEIVEPLFAKHKAKFLVHFDYGAQRISTDVPLTSMDSLKGKVIRTYSVLTADMISALGGSPVSMGMAEVYTALQRGTIHGVATASASIYLSKLSEVVKYTSLCEFSWAPWGYGVQIDAWNKLPSELQKVLLDVAAGWEPRLINESQAVSALALESSIKYHGLTATGISPKFREEITEKMKPIWDKWAKTIGPEGPKILERTKALAGVK